MYNNEKIKEELSNFSDYELSKVFKEKFNVIYIGSGLFEVYNRKFPLHTASVVMRNGNIVTCYFNKYLLEIITKTTYFKNVVKQYSIKNSRGI